MQRSTRTCAFAACVIAALAVPGVASAADTVIVADPAADQVAALDGVVVWTSDTSGGQQVLMHRTPAGLVARVEGAPRAARYSSIDLGHDSKSRLVLTYQRCSKTSCTAFRDNLGGRRTSYKHLKLRRCSLTTAPAVWRTRLAYGLLCRKPNKQVDSKRSGLYVKSASSSPKRLRLPEDAVKFGITDITAVDLRATRVAAIAADVYEYAFSQTVRNSGLRSLRVASSEGDSNEHATGVSLGTNNVMWTLVDAEHSGDPNEAVIFRITRHCYERERLINPAGPNEQDGFLATDLAVDRTTLYLVVPGTGIVEHTRGAGVGQCALP